MQFRVPPHRARIELNAATGIVLAKTKEEFAGVLKSAINFHKVNASCGAPNGPLLSIEPTKYAGLPAGGGVMPSRSAGSNPSPILYGVAPGGTRNEITCGLGLPASIWVRLNAYAPTPTNATPLEYSLALK